MDVTAIAIPQSIQVEHEAIHSTLVEATQAPGQVGVAAKELAAVLHPHFVREEQIALPPLGFLGPLAAGTTVSEDVLTSVLHAQTEEEVLYPTALLVGDLIRARGQGR